MRMSIIRDENYTFRYALNAFLRDLTDEEVEIPFSKLKQSADEQVVSLNDYKQLVALHKYMKREDNFPNEDGFKYEVVQKRVLRNRTRLEFLYKCYKNINGFFEKLLQLGPDYIANEMIVILRPIKENKNSLNNK